MAFAASPSGRGPLLRWAQPLQHSRAGPLLHRRRPSNMTIRCITCRIASLAGASFALSLAGGCHETQPPPRTRSLLVGPENLARVEKHELSSGPVLSGTLEAQARAELVAEVNG